MSDLTYDFENFLSDPGAVVPPELHPTATGDGSNVVPIGVAGYEPVFGPTPTPNGPNFVGLALAAGTPESSSLISLTGTWLEDGQFELDWACHGTPGDLHQLLVDDVVIEGGFDDFDAWSHPVVPIPAGTHTIQVTYQRGTGDALTDDYGNLLLVDNIVIEGVELEVPDPPEPGVTIDYTFDSGTLSPDFTASDAPPVIGVIPASTAPFLPPFGVRVLAFRGNDVPSAVRSIEVTAIWPTAGSVDFDALISSEASYDFGRLKVDGAMKWERSGAGAAYEHASIPIAPGSHVIRFEYEKDGSASDNQDMFYLANVSLIGVDPTGLTGEPEGGGGGSGIPYARGKIVRHNGGLYLSLLANVITEPGPGDSADWAELVAPPAA